MVSDLTETFYQSFCLSAPSTDLSPGEPPYSGWGQEPRAGPVTEGQSLVDGGAELAGVGLRASQSVSIGPFPLPFRWGNVAPLSRCLFCVKGTKTECRGQGAGILKTCYVCKHIVGPIFNFSSNLVLIVQALLTSTCLFVYMINVDLI